MGVFNYKNYRGEINYADKRFMFSCAELNDAGQLAQMYADIAINADNYQTRFDPASTGSFARVGGMFVIHTRESIEAEIKSGDSFFAVLKDNHGDIAASFWVTPQDPHFSGFCPGGLPGCESCNCTLVDALNGGAVVYPRELIVNAKQKTPGIAHTMFYTIFYVMRKNGYTHSLGEVYGVRGYKDGGNAIEIDMLNERSFGMTASTGGTYIGISPEFEIQIGPLTATIAPRAFCFNYAVMFPHLEREFAELGMKIKFYGENCHENH